MHHILKKKLFTHFLKTFLLCVIIHKNVFNFFYEFTSCKKRNDTKNKVPMTDYYHKNFFFSLKNLSSPIINFHFASSSQNFQNIES